MLILAHRGASKAAPENTLTAFQQAVLQKADGVELDAMVCASGEVVVTHDPELTRLAGLKWRVAQTPWWKLQRADVGSRLGFPFERIPRLEEVLEALPAHMLVNIELKSEEANDLGLSEKVARMVQQRHLTERVLLSSFNPLCLFRLAAAAPELRRGYLLDPDRNFSLHARILAPQVVNYSVHPHESVCTPQRVERWHERGWKVAVWTVDDPARAAELREMGVDYLISNQPAAVRA